MVRNIELDIGDGDSISLNVSSSSTSYLHKCGESGNIYEPGLTAELKQIFHQTSSFLDIGSRYGYYSRIAESFEVDYVFSFEVNSYRANFIKQNCESHVFDIDFSDCPFSVLTDVAKMDIEGDEVFCFDSLIGIPRVYIEIHPSFINERGGSAEEISEYFRENNYIVSFSNHRDHDSEWFQTPPDEETYIMRGERL